MRLSKGDKVTLLVLGSIAAMIAGGVGALFLVDTLTPSIVRKALPPSAIDIHEFYEDDYFKGDFARYVRATMLESEMPTFAQKLGLTRWYNPTLVKAFPYLNVGGESGAGNWWNASSSLDGAYIKIGPGTNAYSLAKYENGCVYFKATAW